MKKPKTVEEYLNDLPEVRRGIFENLRTIVRNAAPRQATETISYGIPALRYKKIIAWYAAFSDHCSLFPTAAIIEEFRNELEKFTVRKGNSVPSG